MFEIAREYVTKGMDYNDLKRQNDPLRAEKRTLIRLPGGTHGTRGITSSVSKSSISNASNVSRSRRGDE